MTASREDVKMIELERVYTNESETDYGELWSNAEQTHVISKEDGQYWIRDENGDVGVANDLAKAFDLAQAEWGDVSLAPANRLARNLAEEDENDGMQYLTEYLAQYGTVGIDAQALANLLLTRLEES
jgi:hypothetical protein